MKTKEEILQEKFDITGGLGNSTEVQFCYSAIFEAMEEYAQQFTQTSCTCPTQGYWNFSLHKCDYCQKPLPTPNIQ